MDEIAETISPEVMLYVESEVSMISGLIRHRGRISPNRRIYTPHHHVF